MEDKTNKIIPIGQVDSPNPSENPKRSLREVLNHIDSRMPEDLEIWDESTPQGDRIKRKKEFSSEKVELRILETVTLISPDKNDREKIIEQIADIYESAFQKLNIPDPSEPNAWRYDMVFAGLVDKFFVDFPDQLTLAARDKSNGREIVGTILDITDTGLSRIQPIPGEGNGIKYANSFIPYDVSNVCVAAENFAIYTKGGTETDSTEKLRLISSIRDDQLASQTFGSRDIRLYGERAIYIAEANEILEGYPEVLPAFNGLLMKLASDEPQLFVDMEKQTLTNIAIAAKNIAESSGVAPKEIIKAVGEQAFEIAKKDKIAAIIFIKFGPKAFAKASGLGKYDLSKAIGFLDLTANYLCAANSNRDLIEGRFLDDNISGFLEDGLIDFIFNIPIEGFANEVVKDSQSLDGKFGAKEVAKVRHAVNMVIVVEKISELAGKPLTPQEKVDYYRSIIKFDKLPYGVIAFRRDITDSNPDIHPPGNGVDHTLAVMDNFANSEHPLLHEINLGLTEIGKDPYLISVSLENGLNQNPQIFADYVTGLGILNKSIRYRLGDNNFVDFLPHPDTPEGKDALVLAISHLGKIYSQASTEAQEKRLDELLVYILKNDQLRIPFFMHLYQSATYETLESLSWVTRLAGTDTDQRGATQDIDGLKQKIDGYLSIELESNNFRLPERTVEHGQETPLVIRTDPGITLADRVDPTLPLGKAISIIASADGSGETGMQVADALSKVRMHSIEDAKTIAGPIVAAAIKHLNLDPEIFNGRMFTFISGGQIVEEIAEVSPGKATVIGISAILGTGPLPVLSYSPDRNAIIIVEDYPGGFSLDGLGEEIMHWVRENTAPIEESNPVVDEFWGYIGRRVARAALNTSGTQTQASNFEEHILGYVEKILEVEKYHALNVGYDGQLRNVLLHAVGYEAGSNVDINNLPKDLVSQSNDFILENYIKAYGPKEEWFIEIIGKIKAFYKAYAKENDIKKIKIGRILAPIADVLDMLPYLDRQKIGI